jgi:hypothetical protein
MAVEIFLSSVSDEFRLYRDQLCTDLTRHNVEVKAQADFKDLGGDTLDKLGVYISPIATPWFISLAPWPVSIRLSESCARSSPNIAI